MSNPQTPENTTPESAEKTSDLPENESRQARVIRLNSELREMTGGWHMDFGDSGGY